MNGRMAHSLFAQQDCPDWMKYWGMFSLRFFVFMTSPGVVWHAACIASSVEQLLSSSDIDTYVNE